MIITIEDFKNYGPAARRLLVMRNNDVLGLVVGLDTDRKVAVCAVMGGDNEHDEKHYTDIYVDDRFVSDEEIAMLPEELQVKKVTKTDLFHTPMGGEPQNAIPLK